MRDLILRYGNWVDSWDDDVLDIVVYKMIVPGLVVFLGLLLIFSCAMVIITAGGGQ